MRLRECGHNYWAGNARLLTHNRRKALKILGALFSAVLCLAGFGHIVHGGFFPPGEH
jgi:hypothetical protein